MIKSKEQRYRLLPEWLINQYDRSLIISGGADARYEIELESSEPSFFSSPKKTKLFIRSELDARDQRVLEELLTAEIVVPDLKKTHVLNVAVIGDTNNLDLSKNEIMLVGNNDEDCDLILIIRTNSTYAELLEKTKYQSITRPHLFIDLAFHHTLSLGPLVFPGETACIACLQGRISTRWGDEAPPTAPQAAKEYSAVATELLATELARIANADTSLTNKTISWNFLDRVVKKDQLLKVPLCPICSRNNIDQDGALALPWVKT